MQLVTLSSNPVPSGAVVGTFKGHGDVLLRFARWGATRTPRHGTACLFPGRAEFIEKYFEVVADLRRRGYAVAIMDWRGQGGSERALANLSEEPSVTPHTFDRTRAREDMRRFQIQMRGCAGIGCLIALAWVALCLLQVFVVIEWVQRSFDWPALPSTIFGAVLAFVASFDETTLAIFLGAMAIGCGVGLLAVSAWLISRASLQPPILELEVAIVAVRAFGIGKGVFRYAERLTSHDAAFRALSRLRLAVYDRLAVVAPAGVPAYRVFSDKVLHSLIDLRPRTKEEFLSVPGVGERAWDQYGPAFLEQLAAVEPYAANLPAAGEMGEKLKREFDALQREAAAEDGPS